MDGVQWKGNYKFLRIIMQKHCKFCLLWFLIFSTPAFKFEPKKLLKHVLLFLLLFICTY